MNRRDNKRQSDGFLSKIGEPNCDPEQDPQSQLEKEIKEQQESYQDQAQEAIVNTKIGRVCFVPISDKWKMKSQVILSSIILFSISFVLVFSLTYFHIDQFGITFEKEHQKVFQLETSNYIKRLNRQANGLVYAYLGAVVRDLKYFQRIYNLNRLQYIPEMLDTPFLLDRNHSILNQTIGDVEASMICYSQFATNSQTPNQRNIEVIKRVNQIVPLMRSSNTTDMSIKQYGAFQEQDQLFFQYHCLKVDETYRPQSLIWYEQSKRLDSQARLLNKLYTGFGSTKIGRGNQDFTDETMLITLTKSIIDQQGNFQGVFGVDAAIGRFSDSFSLNFSESTIIIVDEDGVLVISPFQERQKSNSSFINFFNTSITGFTMEHWIMISSLGKKKFAEYNNCSISDMSASQDCICVWDFYNKYSVIMYSYYIPELHFYIIIYQEELSFMRRIVEQIDEFRNQMLYQLVQQSLILIIAFFCILLLTVLIIHIIFHPLQNITRYSKQIIFQHKVAANRQQIKIDDVLASGPFQALTQVFHQAVVKLASNQGQKNPYCELLESLEYPKRNTFHLLHQQIFDNIDTLVDNHISINKFYGRFIKQEQTYALKAESPKELLHVKCTQQLQIEEDLIKDIQSAINSGRYPKELVITQLKELIKRHQN